MGTCSVLQGFLFSVVQFDAQLLMQILASDTGTLMEGPGVNRHCLTGDELGCSWSDICLLVLATLISILSFVQSVSVRQA